MDTLQLDTTQYIDKKLQAGYSDIVYNCVYKNKIELKLALLFEHKSQPEDYPHLQLLGYMLKIWQTNIKQKQRLMPVVPILFYHGSDEWPDRKMDAYFQGLDENLIKYLPSFEFELINTQGFTDVQIKQMFQMLSLRTGILVLKHIFDDPDKLILEFENIFENLQHLLESENGRDLFETTVIYLFSNLKNNQQKVSEKLKQISQTGGEIALTIAEQLRKEGEKEGVERSIKKVAINLIRNGFNNEIISNCTGLSIPQVRMLRELGEDS